MTIEYVPSSALAIYAHPDDVEFTCAGTLARWARDGCEAHTVICTSGEVGVSDPSLSREKVASIREKESREAAEILGLAGVSFLREPDGILQPTIELRRKLVKEIRRIRPEVVLTGDPTVLWASATYINHPDHRAAAQAALDASFPAAGQPHLYPELEGEGLHAHKPRKIYVTTWEGGDHFVNIETTIDLKVQALKAHESQMREMGDWDAAEAIRKWAAEIGEGKEMAYAESFRVITLESDEWWEKHRGRVVPEIP